MRNHFDPIPPPVVLVIDVRQLAVAGYTLEAGDDGKLLVRYSGDTVPLVDRLATALKDVPLTDVDKDRIINNTILDVQVSMFTFQLREASE